MFGQIFMFLVSFYLIFTGVTDQNYLNIVLGIFASIETFSRLYQLKTGRSVLQMPCISITGCWLTKAKFARAHASKETDLLIHSQPKLSAVTRKLNERPRKTLEYETVVERFNSCVRPVGFTALTGHSLVYGRENVGLFFSRIRRNCFIQYIGISLNVKL
jgi:hypothetical protein